MVQLKHPLSTGCNIKHTINTHCLQGQHETSNQHPLPTWCNIKHYLTDVTAVPQAEFRQHSLHTGCNQTVSQGRNLRKGKVQGFNVQFKS